MKKILTVLFLITSATILYAEAPELKNMMPNSWQKVTRLTEQEEAEFLRKLDLRKHFGDGDYVDYKYRILDTYTQIYREKYNNLEIYRLLSSEVPIEEALQITVTDGVYTDEEKELFLKRPAITEIDFLKDGDIYKYIASIKYGAVHGRAPSFAYNYENIMYRAKNSEDVGVFITEEVYVYFDVRDNNEFVFERCKNQMKGNIGWCTYYESVKDLVEWGEDKADSVLIDVSDFLIDDMKCPLKYSIQNAFDGNPATSYVENTENDMIEIRFYPGYVPDKQMAIINGYAQNNSLYKSNNRIKTFKDRSGRHSSELEDDCLDYQYVPWEENAVISTDIYKGERYNDTCIAELNFLCNNSCHSLHSGIIHTYGKNKLKN